MINIVFSKFKAFMFLFFENITSSMSKKLMPSLEFFILISENLKQHLLKKFIA